MLADRQTHRRQTEHLPRLLAHYLTVGEIATATLALRRDIPDHLIRTLDPLQMTPLVTGLPTRLATRRAAQALRCGRLRQPIQGRQARRIPGVLHKPTLQILDVRLQLNDLSTQLLDDNSLLHHQDRELLVGRTTQVHITQFAAQLPTPTPPEQSRFPGLFLDGSDGGQVRTLPLHEIEVWRKPPWEERP
jgi:hypothetical protein